MNVNVLQHQVADKWCSKWSSENWKTRITHCYVITAQVRYNLRV